MKSLNSFGLHFNLRTKKKKDGKAPIYVAITVNGRKVFMATKYRVNVKCMDKNKGFGRYNTSDGRDVIVFLDWIIPIDRIFYLKLSRTQEHKLPTEVYLWR